VSKFDPGVDYYEILQVHTKAQPEVVRTAYRTLVRELQGHPDLGGTHEQAVLINRAYEVLSDPDQRAEYDDWLSNQGLKSYAQGTYRPSDEHARVVICLNCGRKNRVNADGSVQQAVCGQCGQALVRPPRENPEDVVRKAVRRNILGLPRDLYDELYEQSELKLQAVRLPAGTNWKCANCGFRATIEKTGLPNACPDCHKPGWNQFRLFKCGNCGYEFICHHLKGWPYQLYPRCPLCLHARWHRRAERAPLQRFVRTFVR